VATLPMIRKAAVQQHFSLLLPCWLPQIYIKSIRERSLEIIKFSRIKNDIVSSITMLWFGR